MLSRHLQDLQQCFDLPKSPFELCYHNQLAFGVIAKKRITNNKILHKYLKGFLQWGLKQKQWFSQRRDKNGEETPLVGTISFINHGCNNHSNVELKWVDEEKCHVSLVNRIEKGEEILLEYPKNYSFRCMKCNKRKTTQIQHRKKKKCKNIVLA